VRRWCSTAAAGRRGCLSRFRDAATGMAVCAALLRHCPDLVLGDVASRLARYRERSGANVGGAEIVDRCRHRIAATGDH